ncbi:MAG: DUF1674 domain-containing protein [Gammaproteobacteria bacterium]
MSEKKTTKRRNEDVDYKENESGRLPVEQIGGVEGSEPTRFGDWEKKGRCIDF